MGTPAAGKAGIKLGQQFVLADAMLLDDVDQEDAGRGYKKMEITMSRT
jgi:hypothetical protein